MNNYKTMSFFGLTAFGPESLIQSSRINSNGFTLFFDEDYKRAFDLVMKEKNTHDKLLIGDVKEFMTKTFGFPPLDEEVEFFVMFSGKKNMDDTLTWEEIKKTLNDIRNNLNETAKKSIKYESFHHYYNATYKHVRKETDPNVVFKCPVTYGQNYGFYKFCHHELNNIHHPKRKCDETKYAESLIMSKFLK